MWFCVDLQTRNSYIFVWIFFGIYFFVLVFFIDKVLFESQFDNVNFQNLLDCEIEQIIVPLLFQK